MKVKDWMVSQVVAVEPGTSVKEAFRMMKNRGFRHLPVVKGDRLVGVVTDRDLRRPDVSDVFREWNELYRLSDEIAVEDVMASPVVTVTPETDLIEAACLLVKKKFGALPVVKNGDHLVGILSVIDALTALVSQVSEHEWEEEASGTSS